MTPPIFYQAVCHDEESPPRGQPVLPQSPPGMRDTTPSSPLHSRNRWFMTTQLRWLWLSEIFLLKHLHTKTLYHLVSTNVCSSKPVERVLQRLRVMVFLFLGAREKSSQTLKNGLNLMLSLRDVCMWKMCFMWYVKNLFNKRRRGWLTSSRKNIDTNVSPKLVILWRKVSLCNCSGLWTSWWVG